MLIILQFIVRCVIINLLINKKTRINELKKLLIFTLLAALLLTSCTTGTKPADNTDTETNTESETTPATVSTDDSWRAALDAEPFDYTANDLTPYIKLGE